MEITQNKSGKLLVGSERGAFLVEFAMTIGIFLFFIIAIIDISRYMAVRAVLIKGAQDGLNLAQKTQALDIDIRSLDVLNSDDLSKYNQFLLARQRVVQRASKQIANTLVSDPDKASWAQFSAVAITDMLASGDETIVDLSAAVIRPGESVKITHAGSLEVEWLDHPAVCSPRSATCTNPISAGDEFGALIKTLPIVVELRANINLVMPFFGNYTVTGRALGFR